MFSYFTQTAGLVVAARLSENPDVSVLVLDAGKPNLDDVLISEPSVIHYVHV